MEARDGRGGAAFEAGPCPVTDGCVTQPSEHDARERLGEARALAQDGDDGHLGGLAASCIDLASLLGGRDPAEAEALYREALPLWQFLDARHPGEFLGDVARTRADLAFLLMGRDPAEARVLFREVLSDLRPLAAGDPGEFLPDLARACDNLAALLQWDGLAGEAEALSREAVSAWRDLAAGDPGEFLPELARACSNMAFLLERDRPWEAEALYREALARAGPGREDYRRRAGQARARLERMADPSA